MAIELQLFEICFTISTPLNSQTQPEGGRLGSTAFSLACSFRFCKYFILKNRKYYPALIFKSRRAQRFIAVVRTITRSIGSGPSRSMSRLQWRSGKRTRSPRLRDKPAYPPHVVYNAGRMLLLLRHYAGEAAPRVSAIPNNRANPCTERLPPYRII